jgi:hypothetical protein
VETRRPRLSGIAVAAPRAALVAATLAAVIAGAAAAARFERRAVAIDLGTPRDLHGGAYAGSATCRRCHEDHYASWHRTFHRTMTAEATEAAVRGDFSGATLRHAGVVARMDRDPAGVFRMTFTPEAGGPSRTAIVARTVGSRRYQQYLTDVGGTLWRLPVAYSVEERRWFPMTSAFLFPDDAPAAPDPARPAFGGGVFDRHVARWNDNCVFCHNVAPDPGRDPASGAFRTRVAELGVACEACHGPGAEHARRNADPVRRYTLHAGAGPDPTIVNPARLSPARAADVCGRCHGQRIADDVGPFLAHGDPFVPGDDLGLYTAPLWRDTPLGGDREAFAARFWPDGTPRLTAYEYQGLLQSRCAQRGALTCTTCHGMHEGDPRGQLRAAFAGGGAASDGMCTGCHAALAGDEAKARHSRHDPAGAGARCVACHMPRVVYGVLDVHRSHRIEIPGAPLPALAGRGRDLVDDRPDACALCHDDVPPALFGGDPIARAVAADALGREAGRADAPARARRLGALLEVMAADRYPAVRQLAWRSARRLGACCADYDPSAEAPVRAAAVARARAALAERAAAPDPARVRELRARAPAFDLEIGE